MCAGNSEHLVLNISSSMHFFYLLIIRLKNECTVTVIPSDVIQYETYGPKKTINTHTIKIISTVCVFGWPLLREFRCKNPVRMIDGFIKYSLRFRNNNNKKLDSVRAYIYKKIKSELNVFERT
jgi:hypothetical protein